MNILNRLLLVYLRYSLLFLKASACFSLFIRITHNTSILYHSNSSISHVLYVNGFFHVVRFIQDLISI